MENRKKKILILMDSFKGSISSYEVEKIVAQHFINLNYCVDYYPISDGGEGFLTSIEHIYKLNNLFIKKKYIYTVNQNFEKIKVEYLLDNEIAYVESAKVIGLNLIEKDKRKPLFFSSYGLGEIILDAINSCVKKIYIGLGGSGSVDMGLGLLSGLKFKFYDKNRNIINNIVPNNFFMIDRIESINYDVEIHCLPDVFNCLLGDKGALSVFGPQKGLNKNEIIALEKEFERILLMYKENANTAYFGAAGGIYCSLRKYFNTTCSLGIDYILEKIKYKNIQDNYDFIITGEGKLDAQSLYGKLINGILINTNSIPIDAIVGVNELSEKEVKRAGFRNVYSIVREGVSMDMSINNPKVEISKLLKEVYK